MKAGIVLVHGYTGFAQELTPLSEKLIHIYGDDSIKIISLPGHCAEGIPEFDEEKFTESIWKEISIYKKENRNVVLIGHSTGGNMVLSCMQKNEFYPDLLILAGVPYRVDSDTLNRWNEHREGKSPVSFSNIAKMVSMINRTGRVEYVHDHTSSLIIGGEDDQLVFPSDAHAWKEKFHKTKTRVVIAPETDHAIFKSPGSSFTIDIILRAIVDIDYDQYTDLSQLIASEPEAGDFLLYNPLSRKHISRCPGIQALTGSHIELGSIPSNDPLFANIEITTRCNFRCKYCARENIDNNGMDMNKETFKRILDLLPHAYRVTLVGLGEPLLHPQITDFIEIVKSLKRRVGLVTNASLLDSIISKELISAGLDSIAFSLDTVNQPTASSVRNGSNIEKIIDNIRRFIEIAGPEHQIAKAIFTALSIETLPYINDLIERVSTLGVDIMMLTDLNFSRNIEETMWKNIDRERAMQIRNSIKKAFSRNLPVLSVHALEEFGLRSRYKDFLLLPPDQLFHRSEKRKYCFSPWQTVPVDVNGNITMCDCQPENRVGNILTDPFDKIWRGDLMGDYRKRMTGNTPPDTCRICPRF